MSLTRGCRSRLDARLQTVSCPSLGPPPPTPSNPQPLGHVSNDNSDCRRSSFCGDCTEGDNCWDCYAPGAIETRILRPPVECVRPPCNFTIPAMSCQQPCRPKPDLPCDPLCFDWSVDEPGPNDSYGLNGLNWYDWRMEEINKNSFQNVLKGFVPEHPGFTRAPPPPNTPVYLATQPLECYGRQSSCPRSPFATDVNHVRDWRCAHFRSEPAWRPPCVRWATNQHL